MLTLKPFGSVEPAQPEPALCRGLGRDSRGPSSPGFFRIEMGGSMGKLQGPLGNQTHALHR